MKKQQILKLLQEASVSTSIRTSQIQVELSEALWEPKPTDAQYDQGRATGIEVLFDSLFVDMYHIMPERLPDMLPVFWLMCGDRKSNVILADLD